MRKVCIIGGGRDFPSGTGLYQLGNTPRLRQAYRAITELLTEIGIPAPSFPSEPAALSGSTTGFSHKSYGSQYGSLPQRRELVRRLCGEQDDRIRSLCEVVTAVATTQGYKVRYRELPTGELRTELFSDLVLATGRFGGTALEQLLGPPRIALQEQRYEIGIRIEHPNGRGFLGQLKDNDVKLILDGDGLQIRTFCTCRDGEVWHIPYPGGSALSGRSDGPRSGFSNFGLLPRFSGERCDQGRAIWRHFKAHLGDSRMAFWQPLPEFLGGAPVGAANDAPPQRPWQPRDHFVRGPIDQLIHSELRAALRGGLHALLAQYPDLDSPETICLFPAIEGVGLFPATDADLKVETESIWCCGDVAAGSVAWCRRWSAATMSARRSPQNMPAKSRTARWSISRPRGAAPVPTSCNYSDEAGMIIAFEGIDGAGKSLASRLLIILLDIDPALAWQRRSDFRSTEIGRWDGFAADPAKAFCGYQGSVRSVLTTIAAQQRWPVVTQTTALSQAELGDAIEALALAALAK